MKRPRGFISGLLSALASLLLLAGAGLLSLTEGQVRLIPASIPYPTLPVYDYSFPNTPTVSQNNPQSTRGVPTSAAPNSCTPPYGWLRYRVMPGDTLQLLSQAFPASVQEITSANCLVGDSLPLSSIIYLPPVAMTNTPLPSAEFVLCGPPSGWVPYLLQPLDNLFRLSLAFGVSIPELQFANCLGNSSTIYAGNYLMVPNIPTRTPIHTLTETFTSTFSPTLTMSSTHTQTLIVSSPTATFTLTPTPTPTFTETLSPSPTVTNTPPISETPSPTISPSSSPSPSATSTSSR